jgi:UDP-N-acetylmuramyl tripeptide synthase
MKGKKNGKSSGHHFPLVPLTDANQRAGKHHKIVSDILSDLARLDQYSAIKIDLAVVGEKKAALRSAVLRAAQKQKVGVATSSDDNHLYVFRSMPRTNGRDSGH